MNTLTQFTSSDPHLVPPQGYPPTHFQYQAYQETAAALPLIRNTYYSPSEFQRFNSTMDSMQHADEGAEDYETEQKVRYQSWLRSYKYSCGLRMGLILIIGPSRRTEEVMPGNQHRIRWG
jgi:hypothetical protein